ncbi:MAG: VWA domain-containing protein [Verrucomicrobia bacterium]|nr:VWA domain-containing protein [Verrucomicrobiota bacterium]
MSILFQYPALLGLLALAALPPLVHLLSRARPPVYRFSNTEFLRRVLRTTARFRRPRDRFLLVLRTLAVAALAAAFAAPYLISGKAAPAGGTSTAILLIDRSASMAARDGAGTRFDSACNQAVRFLAAAKPKQANIIWIDASPDPVFPAPGPNLTFLLDKLKQSKPLPESGPPSPAFDLALRQIATVSGRRELVVISDFQSAAWREFAPKLPADVILRAQRVGESVPNNTAVARLTAQPNEPVRGQEITLLTEVRNHSPEPVTARLALDAGGALQSQSVSIPPWGGAQAAFVVRPAAAGPLPVTVSLASEQADGFPQDDSRHLVVPVRDSLRLALTGPADAPDSAVLKRIAGALDWLEIVAEGSPLPPDFIYQSGWDGTAPEAILKAAENGVAQIVRPAPGCASAGLSVLLGNTDTVGSSALAPDISQAGWQVIPAADHPAIRMFKSGDFGNPFAGVFRERLKLPAAAPQRTVATYADGVPALIERPTSGAPVLLWNLPLDPAKTDWPTRGIFLPAIAEILLRSRGAAIAAPVFSDPGLPVAWSSADPAHAGAVSLQGPDAQALPISESATGEGSRWQSADPAVPGIYHWLISSQPVAHTAVNFPEIESDLRTLDETPAFGNLATGDDSLARRAALARGVSLWPWLALAALGFLTIESIVHLRSRPAAA